MRSVLDGFTASKVVEITGVAYETLNYWAKIGLVKSSVAQARGSGSRRVYSFEDLVAIRVAQKLRLAGVFGKSLVRIVEVLRQAGFDSAAAVSIVIEPSGDVVVTERAGQSFSALQRPGQLFLDLKCDLQAEAEEISKLVGSSESSSRKPVKRAVRRVTGVHATGTNLKRKRRA